MTDGYGRLGVTPWEVLINCQVGTPRSGLLANWPFLYMQFCLERGTQAVPEHKARRMRWIAGEPTRLRTKLEY